jgi:hypothetical protein
MARRRARPRIPELTSLLDVLFILVFAALIQARSAAEPPDEAIAIPVAPPSGPVDAGVPAPALPDAGPGDADRRAREVIARTAGPFLRSIQGRPTVLVGVSGAGHIVSITPQTARGVPQPAQEIRINLLRESEDPDVKVAYRGMLEKDHRICEIVRRELGVADLGRALILIATDEPLAKLRFGLVRGLENDAATCQDDAGGFGVLLDPEAARPNE